MPNRYTELTDQSPMPYGAHVNTKMEKVPASYLLWMWNDGVRAAVDEDSKRGTVARYIRDNMNALKMDDPDTLVEP